MKKIGLMLLVLLPLSSMGFTLDWKGNHRVEFVEIDKPGLKKSTRKSYLLNHLTLSPTIVASDGINIVASFEILNDKSGKYPNSKLGEIWGTGVGASAPKTSSDSNTLSNQQPSSDLQISQLYLKIDQEYSNVMVGRMPVDFGLGITHNSGRGPFDHWLETRDTMAFRFFTDNSFFMPSVSKVKDGEFRHGDDITDQTLHFEYNNPDTGNLLGFFYETRKSTVTSNDTPQTTLGATSKSTHFNTTSTNFILGKTFDNFDFKIEGGFKSGSTGLLSASGNEIKLNGFAVVTEMNYNKNTDSAWKLLFGTASGDNPSTDAFEGYMLNRNFDIAMLMFNHPMGDSNLNILKNKINRGTLAANQSADDDNISNALFVAPSLRKKLNDNWIFTNTLAWARLNDSKVLTGSTIEDVKSDIGFEWDLAFSYKPHNNIEWKNVLGFFFPGEAYKGGSLDLKTSNVIGLTSSAAISF